MHDRTFMDGNPGCSNDLAISQDNAQRLAGEVLEGLDCPKAYENCEVHHRHQADKFKRKNADQVIAGLQAGDDLILDDTRVNQIRNARRRIAEHTNSQWQNYVANHFNGPKEKM